MGEFQWRARFKRKKKKKTADDGHHSSSSSVKKRQLSVSLCWLPTQLFPARNRLIFAHLSHTCGQTREEPGLSFFFRVFFLKSLVQVASER